MPRIARNNLGASFFHIMVQGINKEQIFNTKDNKTKYCDLIYKNNKEINIIAYCMMDNHAHMLIYTKDILNIKEWMKKTNTSYARYYNSKNNRVGYVFRDRYKLQNIKNIKHLYLCIRYIHNNPVKAGICKEMVDYNFSSYVTLYNANLAELNIAVEEIIKEGLIELQDKSTDEFELIEDETINKDTLCQNIIKEFLINTNIALKELKNTKELLVKLIKKLKIENNISYRIIEKNLEINREKLRKLMKGIQNDKYRRKNNKYDSKI